MESAGNGMAKTNLLGVLASLVLDLLAVGKVESLGLDQLVGLGGGKGGEELAGLFFVCGGGSVRAFSDERGCESTRRELRIRLGF